MEENTPVFVNVCLQCGRTQFFSGQNYLEHRRDWACSCQDCLQGWARKRGACCQILLDWAWETGVCLCCGWTRASAYRCSGLDWVCIHPCCEQSWVCVCSFVGPGWTCIRLYCVLSSVCTFWLCELDYTCVPQCCRQDWACAWSVGQSFGPCWGRSLVSSCAQSPVKRGWWWEELLEPATESFLHWSPEMIQSLQKVKFHYKPLKYWFKNNALTFLKAITGTFQ